MHPLDSQEPTVDPVLAVPALPGPRQSIDVAVLVRRTQDLLAAGVPLTLLLDLGESTGPHSEERYSAEPADLSWVPHRDV